MSSEEDKDRGGAPPSSYGTFQGVPTYPPPSYPHPPQPQVTGFPQPTPPPGLHHNPASVNQYQTVPGYAIAEGRPVSERRLPCCGIGIGWFLFIVGFFLGAIPWYIGAFIMLSARLDPREKPGYIACTIAAVVATIAIIFGVAGGVGVWS